MTPGRLLDPQLHTHNVIVNVTQESDGSFKALDATEMYRAIRYAGEVLSERPGAGVHPARL